MSAYPDPPSVVEGEPPGEPKLFVIPRLGGSRAPQGWPLRRAPAFRSVTPAGGPGFLFP